MSNQFQNDSNSPSKDTDDAVPTVLPLPTTPLSTQPGPNHSWQITLAEKVIAITGANQGIGLGIAEVCLCNSAAAVYSLDIKSPGADFLALQHKHPNLLFLQTDVTIESQVQAAIDAIVATHGRIDGFVANAGITKHQPALAFTRPQLEDLFNLNVFASYTCAMTAARKFISLGTKGSIVFTASMTSYRPNRAAPSAPYGATKASLRNLTSTLALEWSPHGIRVNSVSPGFVRTPMTTYYTEADPAGWAEKMRNYGGMQRLALPQEVGGAYVWLLSEGASYVTGIDVPVAGGWGHGECVRGGGGEERGEGGMGGGSKVGRVECRMCLVRFSYVCMYVLQLSNESMYGESLGGTSTPKPAG